MMATGKMPFGLFERRKSKQNKISMALPRDLEVLAPPPMITTSAASIDLSFEADDKTDNVISDSSADPRKDSTVSNLEQLHVDYVPSWKPNRRYTSPAVRYHRSFSPRRDSKNYLATPSADIQRNRASSLPNTEVARNGSRKNSLRPTTASDWNRSRSPSRVEQRFLGLPESNEYDKIRSFGINEKGELVDHGYCYRHRSDTSSSESATGRSTSSEPDSPLNPAKNESGRDMQIKKHKVLVVGALEVGKTSLVNQFQNCELANLLGRGDSIEGETEKNLSVLISGSEVELSFSEFDVARHEEQTWPTSEYSAVLVIYTITSKRTFSIAADTLYRLREQMGVNNGQEYIPMFLVANKIDLERQRTIQEHDGKELAKSYDSRFIEISVGLGHRTDELLKNLLLEIRKFEAEKQKPMKDRRKSSSFKKRKSIIRARKPRANSLHSVPIFGSLGRRLARSCEDMIARLWKS